MKLKICLLFWFVLISTKVSAQTLDQFDLKKGFTVTGGLNLSAVGYQAWGVENRREPFNFFLTGNLTLGLFGYVAPFTFSYSNAQSSFAQPFNQFRLIPQYKWAKFYMGNTSINFSDYTLAGHLFYGYGVELSPKKWRISLMRGRLKKEVGYDLTDSTQHTNASFKRMGYGAKVKYEGEKTQWGLIFFRAKDDPTSLPFVLNSVPLTPESNVAVGINGRKTLGKLSVEFDYSFSVLNTNMLAAPNDTLPNDYKNNSLLKFLMPQQNPTTRYFDAFNTSIGYQQSNMGITFKYERISPEYKSLGAYFFNNDMENWLVQPNFKFLKGKVTLAGQVGLQRNNLDEARNATTKRWVTSSNITWVPKESWNFLGSYSNFSSYTRMRPNPDPFFRNPLDTLNFYQINHNGNTSVSYIFGDKKRKQSLMLMVSYQQSQDKSAYQKDNKPSQFYNGNLSYSISLAEKSTNISFGLSTFLNFINGMDNKFVGPSLNISKPILKKAFKSSLSTSYSYATANGSSSGDVINSRINLQYSPVSKKEDKKPKDQEKNKKKATSYSANFSLNYVQKMGSKGYKEMTATLNLGANF